jgi:hypothetical protein
LAQYRRGMSAGRGKRAPLSSAISRSVSRRVRPGARIYLIIAERNLFASFAPCSSRTRRQSCQSPPQPFQLRTLLNHLGNAGKAPACGIITIDIAAHRTVVADERPLMNGAFLSEPIYGAGFTCYPHIALGSIAGRRFERLSLMRHVPNNHRRRYWAETASSGMVCTA